MQTFAKGKKFDYTQFAEHNVVAYEKIPPPLDELIARYTEVLKDFCKRCKQQKISIS
jgi:hypothetical protein